jgi:hypothetical protein
VNLINANTGRHCRPVFFAYLRLALLGDHRGTATAMQRFRRTLVCASIRRVALDLLALDLFEL